MLGHACVEGTLGVYELNRVVWLQDVFVWAYEGSCQRYLAITQSMVEPDPLKIKYREALIEAVQSMVKGLQAPDPQRVAQLAAKLACSTDQKAFVQLLTDALRQLHEGSVVRWRFKRLEFLA
ncbi:hypothetical protein BH10PSE16_BH10PSE16_41050 [soil metagenome]